MDSALSSSVSVLTPINTPQPLPSLFKDIALLKVKCSSKQLGHLFFHSMLVHGKWIGKNVKPMKKKESKSPVIWEISVANFSVDPVTTSYSRHSLKDTLHFFITDPCAAVMLNVRYTSSVHRTHARLKQMLLSREVKNKTEIRPKTPGSQFWLPKCWLKCLAI